MSGLQEVQTCADVQSANPSTGTGEKKCTKCGEIKDLTKFYLGKRQKNGYRSRCKVCFAKAGAEKLALWRKMEVAHIREWTKQYRINHLAEIKGNQRRWYNENKDYPKKWRSLNPEKVKQSMKKSYKKRISTPHGRLNGNIKTALHHSLCGGVKNGRHWETLVGFTVDQLKKHLEKQFKPGMNWENYGKQGWEIDHIIPISAFNFEKTEDIDFKRCWALKNLQPLWAKENLRKHAKLTKPFQPALAIIG